MSIRKLPKAETPSLRAGLGFDLAPSALARFDAGVRAADDQGDVDNTISILGPIGQDFFGEGVTARRIAAALRAIGEQEVVVYINSPGGDYFEGLAIYNLLRDHKGKVTIRVLGIAASAASVIAMAGDVIEVARAGFLMIHNTWVVAAGDRNDLREYADLIEPFDKVAADVYAVRSGVDPAEVQKMMDRETWIGGQDAVEKGFADALLATDQIVNDPQAALEVGVHAALRRIDVALARDGMARSERRRLIAEIKSGTPSAAEPTTPSAGVNAELAEALGRIAIR